MYKAWLEWLQNDDIPSEEKCEVLHKQDEQGWCALHYAVRYYCTDILGAALEVEGGKQAVIGYMYMCYTDPYMYVQPFTYLCVWLIW